jgi:glycosyltransferase involved in cell wall biosynthesis
MNFHSRRSPSPFSFCHSIAEDHDHCWYAPSADTELHNAVAALPPSIRRLLIVGTDYSLTTGVMRPIGHYLNAMTLASRKGITSVELAHHAHSHLISLYFHLHDFVLINGIAPFFTTKALAVSLDSTSANRCAVYLHETAWVFTRLCKQHPENYYRAISALKRVPVFCVSKAQASWLKATLNVRHTYVINNYTAITGSATRSPDRHPRDWRQPLTILMSGTVQHRKGASLFSQVADLAHSLGLPWTFMWAGRATSDPVYKSPQVKWLGDLNEAALASVLSCADLFFLSSEDDPMPLSAIEAMLCAKRLVAYRKTGTAELVEEHDGGWQIYESYTPEAALDAITRAIGSSLSPGSVQRIRDNFSLSHFVKKVNIAIDNVTCLPTKRVIVFCENANHVRLAHRLAQTLRERNDISASFSIATYDWTGEVASWVEQERRRLTWTVSVNNIFAQAATQRRQAFYRTVGQQKFSIVSHRIIHAFFRSIPALKNDLLVVMFNDSSVRGRIISDVCNSMNIRRFLVQDGFLTFRSKSGQLNLTDSNFFWGHSNPYRIAVWGETMQSQVTNRFGVHPSRVTITGPIDKAPLPSSVTTAAAPLRLLWIDQAILDQRKAPEAEWLKEFKKVAEALAPYSTVYRPHPSTTKQTLAKLLALLPKGIEVDTGSPLSREQLMGFNGVVTYYSTVFLDALAANIHCIFYHTEQLDIEMPSIQHPLLHYARTIDELRRGVEEWPPNLTAVKVGKDIFKHIAHADRCVDIGCLFPALLQQTTVLGSALYSANASNAIARDQSAQQ